MNYIKISFLSLFLFSTVCLWSQIGINSNIRSSNSVLLEFNNHSNNNMGITLPVVDTTSTQMVMGTILFDKSDSRIKYKDDKEWVSLSYVEGDLERYIGNNSNDTQRKIVIGDNNNSATPGLLVLESQNKAMVLPHVINPMVNVKNPYPGMICYDPTIKAMYLFDGRYWNIWRKNSEIIN